MRRAAVLAAAAGLALLATPLRGGPLGVALTLAALATGLALADRTTGDRPLAERVLGLAAAAAVVALAATAVVTGARWLL